jgi:transcription initiation factor TFIIB
MGKSHWIVVWFWEIPLLFSTVRIPMVQKLALHKGEILSCSNSTVITDSESGEMICQSCGRVLAENTDFKDCTFMSNEEYSHTGPRITLAFHDMGLSTIIGRSNHDYLGKSLGYEMKHSLKRMRLWDSRSQAQTTAEQNLRKALYEMNKLKEKLGLSNAIIERASYLYRKAAKAHLIRGRTVKSIVGACLYAACRDMDNTRTIIDISNHLQEKRKLIAKAYRMLFQNLRLTVPVTDPINCIIKFSNNLEIPETTKREAIKIFYALKEKELTAGKNPNGVAATVIYMACIKTNVNISMYKIKKISGITEITIRNRFKDFSRYVKLI